MEKAVFDFARGEITRLFEDFEYRRWVRLGDFSRIQDAAKT